MIYCIWGLLGIAAYIKKNSKAFMVIMFAFILAVFCFNTDNPDLLNYKNQFNGTEIFGREPVFYYLNRLFYHAGINYYLFRFLLVFFSLLLVTAAFWKLSPYPAWMLFLYSIYPMTIDVVQIRFFIAYSIVIYGVTFLADYQISRNHLDIIWFAACILLGTGFHFAVIFYGILLILFLDYDRYRLLCGLVIPVGMLTAFFMLPRFASLIALIIGNHKAGLWIQKEKISSVLHILRIVFSRSMPLLFSVVISFLLKNDDYNALYGSSINSTGLTFRGNVPGSVTSSGENRFYDLKINRCLFLSTLYIFTFSMLEITIASNYERVGRLGLILGTLLITRQQKSLVQGDRSVSHIALLVLYVMYFISIMYFSREKQGMLFIKYVFRRVMENNSLFGTGYLY